MGLARKGSGNGMKSSAQSDLDYRINSARLDGLCRSITDTRVSVE